jgi:hypothetical protein
VLGEDFQVSWNRREAIQDESAASHQVLFGIPRDLRSVRAAQQPLCCGRQ